MNINNTKHNSMPLETIIHQHAQWLQGEDSGRRADLRWADLSGADLSGADLSGADLSGADLSGADLSGAVLRRAVLRRAVLSGADLSGADLRRADLSGAVLRRADLRRAVLRGAVLSGADLRWAVLSGALDDAAPRIADIHQSIYNAASQPQALEMRTWHTCETTHCRAGWVIALAGDAGRAMEHSIGASAAAAIIYMSSDPTLECVPDFYASNKDALADMKRLAEAEANQNWAWKQNSGGTWHCNTNRDLGGGAA